MTVKTKTAKIRTDFSVYANAPLSAFVNAVITGVTGNTNFPLTQTLLPGITTSLDTFDAAMADAQSRDKVAIGIRNTARLGLIEQLTSVAASVTFEAAGDRDKLLSSNFVLYKTRDTPPAVLGPITGFKVTDAVPGGLTLECDGVAGIKSYTHQVTPDPLTAQSVWSGLPISSRQFTIENLPSGKKFWCRIIATGTKGQVAYSDTLSRITQ